MNLKSVHPPMLLAENRAMLEAQHLFRTRLQALLLQDPSSNAFGTGLNAAVIDLLDALQTSRRRLLAADR